MTDTDRDYLANVRDARHWIARDRSYEGTWVEKSADALEEVVAQRDALRAQLDAVKAAWNKSTGWREFGEETGRILRAGR